jgi:DNA sulfur modification protein DndB
VEVLQSNLSLNLPPYRNKPVPAFHLAVWLFRGRVWPAGSSAETLIKKFLVEFRISDTERALFDLSVPTSLKESEIFCEEETNWNSLREVIGSPLDARPEGGFASFPALLLTQNKHKFYFATMPIEDIFPYCFVANRHEDPSQGFQRTLSIERAHSIANYLDQSEGSIPTNIVLSAQEEADLIYISKSKTIRYKRVPKAFLVLDGQHRLYGYGFTTKHHRVPVAIYEGLTRKEEAKLFIDINTNQRGVPAALLLDIKQVAEQETLVEAQLRRLFDKLAEDSDSPLNGLLSPAKSATGKISRVTFNKSVANVLKNVVMSKLEDDKQYVLFRNYLRAVEQSLQNPKLIRRAAYFEAFCDFFEDVIRLSRERHKNYKEESLTEILLPISNVDLGSLPSRGTTKISKTTILEVLKNTISGQIEVSEDMV